MTNLRIFPSYPHKHEKKAPETKLTNDTAFGAYAKLRSFLALEIANRPPAGGWDGDHRDLFSPDGFHHAVRWMPVIKEEGWRRLNYDEFLAWYAISPFDRRERWMS